MDSDGGFRSIGCLECLGRNLCIVDCSAAATAGPHINRLRTRNTPDGAQAGQIVLHCEN
jgi:hypothetical protein